MHDWGRRENSRMTHMIELAGRLDVSQLLFLHARGCRSVAVSGGYESDRKRRSRADLRNDRLAKWQNHGKKISSTCLDDVWRWIAPSAATIALAAVSLQQRFAKPLKIYAAFYVNRTFNCFDR